MHGLTPAPRLQMKFRSQADDDVNGNDFINRCVGPNATRWYPHFKRFFAVQKLVVKVVPKREDNPNWKVGDFLAWILTVSINAWICERNISVDKQTLCFHGRHPDKLRITYKREGDRFQCDSLCNDGYTYAFYFRNDPPTKHDVNMGLSPIHSRVMFLFDTLKEKYHTCGMEYLYTSARFCKDAYNHPNKVMCHGVAGRSGRGIPSFILQDEVTNLKDQLKVLGTVKATDLKGDANCFNLCSVYVYDTKPVHFMTMSNDSIEWIKNNCKV